MGKSPWHSVPDEFDRWVSSSDSYTLKKVREAFGLPELTWKEVPCKGCSQLFRSQFKGSSKQLWFCQRCRSDQFSQSDPTTYTIGGR